MDGDPWRSSTGIGLHVKTPLGPMPIRLYWTHALDEVDGDETESFQFTFGAFF
ncbi:MAG: BamA/TamA family outer membrane protein [Planctomycetes bacterium]|nr:BamA/TamA family outer membrane protein [Planctomycetota bacterium]